MPRNLNNLCRLTNTNSSNCGKMILRQNINDIIESVELHISSKEDRRKKLEHFHYYIQIFRCTVATRLETELPDPVHFHSTPADFGNFSSSLHTAGTNVIDNFAAENEGHKCSFAT